MIFFFVRQPRTGRNERKDLSWLQQAVP